MKPHTLIVIICGIFLSTRWTLRLIDTDGWDIYHFMYTSQRLLEGELAWTVEYVDKLLVAKYCLLSQHYLELLKFGFQYQQCL